MTLSLSRRSLVAGSALVAASFAVGSAASALDGGATCLRPPSAEDEERFRSLCLKCDRCRSACPQGCVRTGTLEHGLLNWRTPVTVSYTHLRSHETLSDLVCRLLL